MLVAGMTLVGVVLGAVMGLAVSMAADRRRERRDEGRRAVQAKQECYQRTLQAIDELLTMRSDDPDLGITVRAITADITQLRLTAPPAVAELADMCVQAALRSASDPAYRRQLRAHFIDTAREDLLAQFAPAKPLTLPSLSRTASRQARHAKPRRV